MRSLVAHYFRKFISTATTAIARKYVRKDRSYRYKDLHLKVLKDVFHPGLFRSTNVFAEWLMLQHLEGKQVLEIGSGSGLIALIAAKKNAIVTAVDINPKAVENTMLNANINKLDIQTYRSDLFSSIPQQHFDIILINPPYYPKQPANDYEKAWFCGIDFSYFRNLFQQLKTRSDYTNCYIILSDTCDLTSIMNVAGTNGITLKKIYTKKIAGEQLIIYSTASINPA